MSKDDWVYVGHILDMSQKALELSAGMSRSDYDQDEALKLALTHIVQIIGEAASKVSFDFKEAHHDVPWHEMIGMRNRIVHDYLNVDEDVIWEVVQQDLPDLAEALRKIVPPDM